MLGKFLVPGRPSGLESGGARAYCACGRYRCGLFGCFCSRLSFLLVLLLLETARYRLKYCLKGR